MQNFTEKDLFQHISVDTEPMCGEVDAILLIVGAVITNINNNKSYDDSVKLKRTEMDPFRLG